MEKGNYPRLYKTIVESHLQTYRQMVFLSGPRQVGKTTVCEQISTKYVSWDDDEARRAIQSGQHNSFTPALAATFALTKKLRKAG